MYCSNCGNKMDEKAVVCTKCGAAVDGKKADVAVPGKGKSIASMVLGILGVVFGLLYLVGVQEIPWEYKLQMSVNSSYKFGFAIGSILIPLVFAIIGICLAVSARKQAKNGQNTAGFWLSITTFVLCAITFIIVLAS